MAKRQRVGTALERARLKPSVPERLRRALLLLQGVARETVRGFRADRGVDLAGSLAFATLLTAVPLLATLSLLLAAFFQENVNVILDIVNAILPYHAARVTDSLREFVAQSTTISGIGLLVLLLASVRLIFIVERVFNAVWGAPKRRGFLSRVALYMLVLFVLALLVGSIGLGVRVLRRSAVAGIVSSNAVGASFLFAIEFLAFTLLYRLLPNARVRWGPAAIAGGAAVFSLELLRALFGLYVHGLSRMNLITGSLTFLLLTLLSIYFAWVLVLLGVELTHVLETQTAQRKLLGRAKAGRAESAIRMLLRLSGGGIRPLAEFSGGPGASAGQAEKILECLRENGLVQGDSTRGFALARPPHEITIAQVVDAVSTNLYSVSPEEEDRVVLVLEPLFHRLDAERRALLGLTIADLAGC